MKAGAYYGNRFNNHLKALDRLIDKIDERKAREFKIIKPRGAK